MRDIPNTVKGYLTAIKEKGCEAYVIGNGLYCHINDEEVDEWNVITNAGNEILNSLKKPENVSVDVWNGSVERYFESRITRIEAMAFDGERLIDEYDGLKDVKNRTLRMLYEPDEAFEEEPLFMTDIVQRVAETGFEVSDSVYGALKRHCKKLLDYDLEERQEIFREIMLSKHVGEAVWLMERTGVIGAFVGFALYESRNIREKNAIKKYTGYINSTKPLLDVRVISLFLLYWGNRDIQAAKYLYRDGDMVEKMIFVHKKISDLNYANNKKKLDKFISEHGIERYDFIDAVSRIQSKVLNLNEGVIARREKLLQEII